MTVGVQASAVGAFQDQHVGAKTRRAGAVHRTLRRDRDVARNQHSPFRRRQPDHRRAGNMSGVKPGCGETGRQRERLVERHRRECGHQPVGRHLVEERQLALLLQPRCHDAPCVLVQHTRQFDGHRRRVDRRGRVTLADQLERAGVVGVCVCDEDSVQPAALLDQAEVGQLVAGQPPARLGRRADAGVDEHAASGDFNQDAACADFVSAAKKGDLHRRHVRTKWGVAQSCSVEITLFKSEPL